METFVLNHTPSNSVLNPNNADSMAIRVFHFLKMFEFVVYTCVESYKPKIINSNPELPLGHQFSFLKEIRKIYKGKYVSAFWLLFLTEWSNQFDFLTKLHTSHMAKI